MNLEQADIILHSNINTNCYYLFKDKIVVETQNKKYQELSLPKDDKLICFYDIYYAKDGLRIIIASRECYDRVFILDEYTMSVTSEKLTK